MSLISRRNMIKGSVALLGLAAVDTEAGKIGEAVAASLPNSTRFNGAKIGKVDPLADGVFFHEGNLLVKGTCNAGWVVFEDYVLVIDASFPLGAREILPKIRAITDKPVRFAFDTHHHGDHAYGNQVMVDNGATPVAHTGVIEEMKRYETGYYGGQPGNWEKAAKLRPDMNDTHLKPPSVLFPQELIFDDGKHRVELIHLGVAHTHGDALAWLPKERILFSGDVCVNGPYNYVGDGNVEKWVGTLDAARKLGARIVCPGHGARGEQDMLEGQQAFFKQLREKVGALVAAKKSPQEIHDAVEGIAAEMSSNSLVARYVNKGLLASQVEKVMNEMTGQKYPDNKPAGSARDWHAHQHGLDNIG
ncbi:MAG TPA: MBL fold metallo-hydrolase [Blastocatellia bacterium]|nr:MBL fold metallo-hydrolase [Blastocatellia bacterium]